LEVRAPAEGIEYVWSGAILGGLSPLEVTDRAFQVPAVALADAAEDQNVAIFCAEGDPAACHRAYKVGAFLNLELGCSVTNILRSGREEAIADTLARTDERLLPPPLSKYLKPRLID